MLLSPLINEAVEKVYTTHYRKGGAMGTTMPSTQDQEHSASLQNQPTGLIPRPGALTQVH